MDTPPSRLPLYVGLLLILGGLAVIFLGWQRAGQQELETGQIPFVLSGGFGGWALLLLGVAGVLVDVVQRSHWQARRQTDELRATVQRLVEVLERQASDEEDEPVRRPRRTTRTRRTS